MCENRGPLSTALLTTLKDGMRWQNFFVAHAKMGQMSHTTPPQEVILLSVR